MTRLDNRLIIGDKASAQHLISIYTLLSALIVFQLIQFTVFHTYLLKRVMSLCFGARLHADVNRQIKCRGTIACHNSGKTEEVFTLANQSFNNF